MAIPRKPATLAIHGNETKKGKSEPVAPPIFQTSTFIFPDSDSVEGYMARGERKHYIYQRYGNPAQDILEKRMALLEGAEDAAFFASGMAAITSAILSILNEGDEVLSIPALYGQTLNFFKLELPKYKMSCRLVPIDDLYKLDKVVTEKTKLIYFESPTNPNLQVVDIQKIVKQAKALGLHTMIDNTFASSINQLPISMGIDTVVHSATKYLGGHSDVLAGVVVGTKELVESTRKHSQIYGPTISPQNVFLLLRSLATLEIRVLRQNETAMKIAKYLEKHPKVRSVNYPGLEKDPFHNLAKSQMKGFGGMIAIDINGGKNEAMKVVDNLELMLNATSLGGVETLVSIPVITSHVWLSPDELKNARVTQSMIRISVGLEDPDDLIADFDQALNKL
ncbi:trans-sulfuration enzyme family protein [candidate division KSB1 bacterium]